MSSRLQRRHQEMQACLGNGTKVDQIPLRLPGDLWHYQTRPQVRSSNTFTIVAFWSHDDCLEAVVALIELMHVKLPGMGSKISTARPTDGRTGLCMNIEARTDVEASDENSSQAATLPCKHPGTR